jgi:hypothetical protein
LEATTSISTTELAPEELHKRAELWRRLSVTLLCLLLSAGAVVPFYFFGKLEVGESRWKLRMPVTHDMFLHFDQMRSFYRGLAAGVVYPRWEEDTNRGFGAPTTSYYPPGVYYLTSAVYQVVRDWIGALLGAHLLMMIASAAAIYFYARHHMSRPAAALAMAAYIILPYHLIDEYQRGALAEFLGFIWMPLMMLFAEKLFDGRDGKDAQKRLGSKSRALAVAGLAASYGAFIWSHPPTAYQFSLTFGLFVLALAISSRNLRAILLVACAIGLGLALSAAYLYPAVMEQDLIRHEYISENWPYHESYVFAETAYAEWHRQFFNLIDRTWLFYTIAILTCAIYLLAFDLRSSNLRMRVMLWSIVGCFASFMMTSASEPLGQHIPKIDIGVFSWRMLSITTLVVALLVGACAEAAFDAFGQHSKSKLVSSAALVLLVIAAAVTLSVKDVVGVMYNAPVFEPEVEHFNFAIIPRTAPESPEELPDDVDQAELAESGGQVSVEEWKPQHRVIRVELDQPDQLFIRTFFFPGWTATIDGHPAVISLGEDLGDIVLEVPAGFHVITLDYLDTPPRKLGNRITLASFAALMAMVTFGAFKQSTH